MNLENMLGRARKGFNHVLDDLADFTPRRLRHALAAGAMLFMLYSCSGSSGSGGNGNGTTYKCDNGKDDDGDTLIDMADPGCSSKTDPDEYNAPLNNAPVVDAEFNPVSLAEDSATSVALAGHFSDPDGDALTYSVNGFADVIAAVAGNQINISAPANYNGADSGNVKACDTSNACVSTPLDVTFTAVNDGPVVDNIVITTANELYPLAGYVTFHDIDSSTITCSRDPSTTLPQLLVAPDGTISSTGNLDRAIAGSYSVTVSCSDGPLNGSKTTTFDVRDVTAPATIADLITSTGSVESISLQWTSPGDDGNVGKPDHFLVRYALNNPIATETDWNNAVDLITVSAIGDAGYGYVMTIPGVPPGRLCFAIKTLDEANNASGVSNPNPPCADVISRAQYFVDSWIAPADNLYLFYPEVVAMVQGDSVAGIDSRAMELATELYNSNPQFPGTVQELRDFLLMATNGIYQIGDGEFIDWQFGSLLWDNDALGDPGVRTYWEPTGNPVDFNSLPSQNMTNINTIIRDVLINYVNVHQDKYENLNVPGCNPGWLNPNDKTCTN